MVVAAAIPFPSLCAPAWDVWVVGEDGQPVQGMTVRESYQDYSAQSNGSEEDQETDNQGHVKFSAKVLWASTFKRLVVIASELTRLVHASFGPHAYVFAFGRGLEGYATNGNYVLDWTGSPSSMQIRILVRSTEH